MSDELTAVFEAFRNSQKMLGELLVGVQKAYEGLEKILDGVKKDKDLGTNLDIKKLLLSEEDVNSVNRIIFQEPKMVFVGQTNAGKSSLINEILGSTIVKADDVPCTARIVELTYGHNEKPEVEIYSRDGRLLKHQTLEKAYIPSGVANLREEERNDPEMIGSKVIARINNPFLKSGVTVVDSPGKNEYREMDRMVDQHMESVLPLIVYVIDGRNMLSKKDIDDIGVLTRSVPPGNIFFVVTKCDDPNFMEKENIDSDSESESERPDSRLQPTKIEREIKEGIYRKLVDNDFLADRPMEQCDRFHALSSRYVKKYRWAQKRAEKDPSSVENTLRECKRFMDNFVKFKESLLDFVKKQLIETLICASKIFEISLTKCLDYFMETSNSIFNDKQQNEKNIKLIEVEEFSLAVLVQELIRKAKPGFTDAVTTVIKAKRKDIIRMAADFKFVVYQVPRDGFIASNSVNQYKEELREEVLTKIGEMIHNEVVHKCAQIDQVYDDLVKRTKEVQEKVKDKVNIHDALQQIFIGQYKFNIRKAKLTKSLWQKIVGGCKKFFELITFKPLMHKVKGVNVKSAEWREEVAKEVIDVINPDNVADVIVKGICEHMEEGHQEFSRKLKELRELYEQGHRLGEQDRKLIRAMAPVMARLLLLAWNIQDTLKYKKITYGKVRGKGAQGVVQDCDARGPNGEECVAKLIKLEKEEEMGDMGLEIHFSRKLKHENVAEVFGTMYECVGGTVYELAIIMPRMMCDLLQALPGMLQLKPRLMIALKVGRAIEYIHSLHMMHRDIKCANILLDNQGDVKITDFGLCKPPGFSGISFVGTPIHMAPEIIKQEEYSEKVDVFSFGILLWYICEGKGNHPKYVFDHGAIQSLLVETAIGKRPERLKEMRDDCWELMEACWAQEPHLRPDMAKVNQDLTAIIDKL